jgi:hypothetical protein
MKKDMKKVLATVIGAMLVLVFCAGNVMADVKRLNVRSSAEEQGDFKVKFEPVKPVFKVGESIRFKVKGNKTFYLYLFSVDQKEKIGYVLLPNVKQQYIKYKAGKEYMVPEKYIEFYSNNPGNEKVIMVASTKKMDVELGRFKKSGLFFRADAGEVKDEVKSLRIRSRNSNARAVTREMNLVVVGEGQTAIRQSEQTPPPALMDTESAVSTFISTDKMYYKAGEPMTISYGADKKGYVHLFVVEPDGNRTFLKTEKVNGKQYYQSKAVASAPGGTHKVVAIYDEKSKIEEKIIKSLNLDEDSQGKAIRLMNDPESYAVYQIYIQE